MTVESRKTNVISQVMDKLDDDADYAKKHDIHEGIFEVKGIKYIIKQKG